MRASYESRPFFQHEYAAESHGQKSILDRIVETDPGGFKVETSPQYLKDPPERIAVLPFADIGSANFVVDKIAHPSQQNGANELVYAVQVMPALSVQDIAINSAENILQLRDVMLARAEEETCREVVLRVPVSQELKARIEQQALDGAEEVDPVSSTKPASLSESPQLLIVNLMVGP